MNVRILWNSRDWVEVLTDLPVRGPLPCRTVLVPRMRVAHALRRDVVRAGRASALAGTRFVPAHAAAVEVLQASEVSFEPGEEALRGARLSALFRTGLPLVHFSTDLLSSMPGWDEAFAHTISQLEGAGVRPEDLETAEAPPQLRDVATIWHALDESARRSRTVERVYLEAAALLEGHPERWPFQGPALALASGHPSVAEAGFLRTIPQVTIGLLAARPARERYLKRMEALLGAETGAALRSAEAPREAATERDLLASYLFELPAVLADSDRPRSGGPDGTVHLEEHAGLEAELEATADWVARQVNEGIPLEDIAVLMPGLDPLAGLVTDRLARLPWHNGAIPVYVAGGLPLTRLAMGARALAVVRALRAHLAAGPLADVLVGLRLTGSPDGHLSSGRARELVWSLGTVGGNPARPAGALEWATRAREREGELEAQLERATAEEARGNTATAIHRSREIERTLGDLRAVRTAVEALVGVARTAVEAASLSVFWPALRSFLEEWLLQPGTGPRVHKILDERIGRMAADGTCRSLPADEALRLVEEAISSTRVAVGRFGDPAVYVGTVRDAVWLTFSAVRVIGLAEGYLPSIAHEDPVMPDTLRANLRSVRSGTAALVPTAQDTALEDLHTLDAVVRNAQARVVLSAPRLDIDRSQREASSVILEAAAALARPNRATGEKNDVIPDSTALQRDAFAPAREEARRFRSNQPLSEAAWHDGIAAGDLGFPARWLEPGPLDPDGIERLANDDTGLMEGLLGPLISDIPVAGLSEEHPISPSAIENLLRCPHGFLLERLLGFEDPVEPPPQREIGQPHYGNLFHRVAARFYAENGPSFCERQRALPEWLSVADSLVDHVFEEFLKEYPLVGDAVREQQRKRLRRHIHELLEYDWQPAASTTFVASEKPFGSPQPLVLPAGRNRLYLRGQIDRLDVENQRALIRDLKTAKARPRIGRDAEPDPVLDVQIAIYGLAAKELACEWDIPTRIGAAYAYFGRGRAVERAFREDFNEVLEPALRKWLALAARLLKERLFPRTPDSEDCTYCGFGPLCGDLAQHRSRAAAVGNPLIEEFFALRGVTTDAEED